MKFNIAYTGPEHLFNLRRDFILVLKYALEDLGHDVTLAGSQLDISRFNLIIGAYFLDKSALKRLAETNIQFAHINTEIIGGDMLNHNPEKVDFMGDYLPSMKLGKFVWDVVMDNMAEHEKYGVNAHFLRWGWHPKLQDIQHRQEKDLDFYFFGMMSNRRKRLIQSLGAKGLNGAADHICPYFLRNDRISRAKVQLNIIQDDKYTHVNSFRICYLANNGCCILSEHEKDPANYLQYADVTHTDSIIDQIRHLLAENRWKIRGEQAMADFRKIAMKDSMAELLEKSFSKQ